MSDVLALNVPHAATLLDPGLANLSKGRRVLRQARIAGRIYRSVGTSVGLADAAARRLPFGRGEVPDVHAA